MNDTRMGNIGYCDACKQMRTTRFVSFYRNVGMLFRRQTYSVNAYLCKTCIHKTFWEFTAKNVLLGPWGTISLIVTPLYILQNTGHYVVALYKLRDAIE